MRQDLHISQGETWEHVYTHNDSAGAVVNLTGYSARMSIKDSLDGHSQAYLSSESDANGGTIVLGGVNGTVTLSMTDVETANLDEGDVSEKDFSLIYDLELVSPAGAVTRPLEGRVVVSREVTA